MIINIAIADDHQIFIDGLIELLSSNTQIKVCATANNGVELISELQNHSINVVLLDINMPKMDGFETTKLIKNKFPNVAILMLTTHDTVYYIEKMLKAGASGYLLKNTNKTELITAIEEIAKGNTFFSHEVSQTIMNQLVKNEKAKNQVLAPLSDRETEVLKLIAFEFTTQEIADKLFISSHTVETYRKNLLVKLNVRNLAGLVKKAIEMGLV